MRLPVSRFKPRYAPEWGSGGVFGLKYHKGVLYFTLSFEAESYFIRDSNFRVYKYELVGPEPRSGGDTYNAVEAVDDSIYFGGWVHAPVAYRVLDNYVVIDFKNKYAHIHAYDVGDDRVKLLWSESAGLNNEWVGEVSAITFDPLNIRLLVSRADGSKSLGVYSLSLDGSKVERLSDKPSLKGALASDLACFDISVGIDGIYGIQCLDLLRGKWSFRYLPTDLREISVDGDDVVRPLMVGSMAYAYGRLFIFVRGGVIVWDPTEDVGKDLSFIRLYDFVSKDYGPLRTNHLIVGGGILIPFNSYAHGMLRPLNEELRKIARVVNYVPAPSHLLYLTPPTARVVTSLGARITSIECVGDELLVATNTAANLGPYDAVTYDIGERELLSLNLSNTLLSRPTSEVIKVLGGIVGNKTWGGIPLGSYVKAYMYVRASRDNVLRIYEYDLGLPPGILNTDVIHVDEGMNMIDLSGYSGITSFRFEYEDPKAVIHISLRG